jgi:hypothetical protein
LINEWLSFGVTKYDGYRLRLERDGDRVRLITSGPVEALGKVQEPKPPRDEQG